jgi:hypothetical protein
MVSWHLYKKHLTFMTFGSVAAMNSFNFRKRWKYFSEPPAIVSLKPSSYNVLHGTPNPDFTSAQTKHAKAVITSGLKTKK